jgi:molybdopterin-guanine dinucleotide biosynthesis protein A
LTEVAVAGALLAGGRSIRFGSDKLQARLPGSSESLAARSARALRESGCAPLAWVAPHAPLGEARGFQHLADSAEGPLGAIALALEWAQLHGARQLLVLAGDLPLIQGPHLAYLKAAASGADAQHAYCAVGPDGRPEPLCAVYPSNWASEAKLLFQSGKRAARALWQSEPFCVDLDAASIESLSTARESSPEVTVSVTVPGEGRDTIHPCFNLNDQEDWEQLQRWSKEGELP